jgi:hypothetical protein
MVIPFSQCTWGNRQRRTPYASLEDRIDVLKEQVVSLESRLAQLPDGIIETPRFRPHYELEVPAPPSNETQHEESFEDYTKQVEGMLGKYMLRFVQYLVKQKWGEVRNGASSLPFSITETPRDTQEVTTGGTSGLSNPAIISSEGDSHLSLYARGIIPDFYSLINPDDGVKFERQQSAVNHTTGAPKDNNVAGNWGEMSGGRGFTKTMSGDLPSTTMGPLSLVNEGPQREDSQTLWPTTSQILSEDMEMYPQF